MISIRGTQIATRPGVGGIWRKVRDAQRRGGELDGAGGFGDYNYDRDVFR